MRSIFYSEWIFSLSASRVILVINLGHDGVQFVTNLTIPPFLPQRWYKRLDLYKNICTWWFKMCRLCFWSSIVCSRPASSFPVISRWLGIQQNIMNLPLDNISWHVCKTPFTRGFLLPWLSMACNTDILSKNITKRSTDDTFNIL